jgi:glycosyltransferase involved in cell wall biosynthesis
MPEISIIIPIYNVEKYLRLCLDSVLAQTFVNYECILVDDGSPDKCPEICDEYAVKDNRFVVVHQKNAGVSAARKGWNWLRR